MLCSCAVVILKWLRMKVVDSAPHASICVHPLSFTSIVEAIRLGRRIFDNLHKAMSFVFAVHVHFPIAGLALTPVLRKWPLVLMPVHVVFLELIIDRHAPLRSRRSLKNQG